MPGSAMIIAGESSGELYGALLAERITGLWPGTRLSGVGGRRMKAAGVDVFSGIAGAFGLAEAVSSFREVRETYSRTVAELEARPPDVLVLIDYPDFNFRVGRKARGLGIKVLYYVSPQVWAWRGGRIKAMADFVDRMAVVLPFEEAVYAGSGIPCEFVGHPVLDDMEAVPADKAEARRLLGLDADRPYVSILPGSRRSELKRHLPVLLEVVRRLKARHPHYGVFLPVAPDVETSEFEGHFALLNKEGVVSRRENAVLALSASEAAVIASGTATLQAAFRETPMVVIYRMFPLTYLIARAVVRVRHATIANIVLGREAVPELLQGRARPDAIYSELEALLSDTARRERMLGDLRAVKSLFEGRAPSLRVAQMAGELAGWGA